MDTWQNAQREEVEDLKKQIPTESEFAFFLGTRNKPQRAFWEFHEEVMCYAALRKPSNDGKMAVHRVRFLGAAS